VAIRIGDRTYVVDCGDGVARQMVLAGIPLDSLRGVFLTHQHSDHTADYGNLLLIAWTAGLRSRVDCFGPPPLERMTKLFFEMNAADIETRIQDEGRTPLEPLIHARNLVTPGTVFEDDRVVVKAALVDHPPVTPAFAFRFDSAGRSVVVSGDTRYSKNLVALAKDADVLVHEVMLPEGVERLVSNVPNAPNLRRSILSHHTTAEEVGKVAAEARAGQVVLTHFVPAEDPLISEDTWRDAVAKHYSGPVVVGRDLLSVDL
jgi:ribonuclease BN (tRNA processing enzyme)